MMMLTNLYNTQSDNFWLPTNLTVVVCTHIDLNFYSINNKRIFVHNSNFLSLIFTFSPIFTKERRCVTILVVFNQTFCVAGSQLHHVFQEPQPDDLKQKINKDLWDTTTSVITKTSEISEVNVSKNSYTSCLFFPRHLKVRCSPDRLTSNIVRISLRQTFLLGQFSI